MRNTPQHTVVSVAVVRGAMPRLRAGIAAQLRENRANLRDLRSEMSTPPHERRSPAR
jgi:hypothetical protein